MAAPTPIDANPLATRHPDPSQPSRTPRVPNEPSPISGHLPLRHSHPAQPPLECANANLPNEPRSSFIFNNIYSCDEPNEPKQPKPTRQSPKSLCYPKFPGGVPMRTISLCLIAIAAHAATTVYQASVDQLTGVHGTAAADSAIHHAAPKSLRVEPGGPYPDALVRSGPVALTIGKRYELSAWVRTDNLTVRDTGRSPIAPGAALSMASMPFDVHSESLAGTRPWTRLSLKFTASRAQDAILLAVANGGAFQGKAWFEAVSLDEGSTSDAWPARESVKTFGPAYRYPAAGWICLHSEGKPYERGYQPGYLMAREIPESLERCAANLGANAAGWGGLRTQASALFLRGFDREILEEMRGIADGASDAGTKWQGRRLDVVDIVVSNITVELGELR